MMRRPWGYAAFGVDGWRPRRSGEDGDVGGPRGRGTPFLGAVLEEGRRRTGRRRHDGGGGLAVAAVLCIIPTTSVAVQGLGRVARAFFRLASGEKLGRMGRGITEEADRV